MSFTSSSTRFPLPPSSATSLHVIGTSANSSSDRTREEEYGSGSDQQQQQQHRPVPLLFAVLPLDLLHTILTLIPITERPLLLHISHSFTSIVTHPSFLLSRESNGTSDEILFLIGGTYPTRTRRGLGGRIFGSSTGLSSSSSSSFFFSETSTSDHRHRSRSFMGQNDAFSRGLWGYVPSLKSWRIFGGDPRRIPDHPMQTIVDSKAVFLPHPHYQVVLLGGYNHLIGEEVNRVVSYSLLTGRWETWPPMLRARKGSDLQVLFVPPNQMVVIGCSHGKCGCSRCAGGSVQLDTLDVDCCNATNTSSNDVLRKAALRTSLYGGGHCARTLYGQTTFLNEDKMMGSGGVAGAVFDGHAEVFDLTGNTWTRRTSRAPSCPPREGGAVVLEDRYVCMPGVEAPSSSTSSKRSARRSCSANQSTDTSSTSGSDTDTEDDGSHSLVGSPIARSPPDSPMSCSGCSTPALPGPASANSRPGLIYDVIEDTWSVLRPCRSPPTRFPTTLAYKDSLLVMGGYRSGRSGDSIMSLFRDGLIVDYEEHANNCWAYSQKEGQWRCASDFAGARSDSDRRGEEESDIDPGLPRSIPMALRGASALVYNGRLTLLGGMTTFNQTGDDEERRVIWQYHEEDDKPSRAGSVDLDSGNTSDDDISVASSVTVEDESPESNKGAVPAFSVNGWRPLFLDWEYGKSTQVKLPVSSLLDTYAFSAHI